MGIIFVILIIASIPICDLIKDTSRKKIKLNKP